MGCFVRGDKNGMGCLVRGDKNGMGCFVRGVKNCMGCFDQGGKSMWEVLSRMSKMAWDVLSRDVLSYILVFLNFSNTYCWYTLKLPHRGNSNVQLQLMSLQ